MFSLQIRQFDSHLVLHVIERLCLMQNVLDPNVPSLLAYCESLVTVAQMKANITHMTRHYDNFKIAAPMFVYILDGTFIYL